MPLFLIRFEFMYYDSTQIENVFKIDAEELLNKLNSNYFNEDKVCMLSNLSIRQTNHVQIKQILNLINEKGLSDKIKKLDLGLNQLTELPAEIGNLANLSVLHLYKNQLTELPGSIRGLTSLTRLHLDSNKLTALPDSICELTSLTALKLVHNQLKALPAEICNLASLTKIDLWYNQLKALPDSIWNLPCLTELNLRDNCFTELSAEIGNLASLEELYLHDNQLKKLDYENASHLCSTRFNTETNVFQKTLPFSIGNLTKITRINRNQIDDLANWPHRKLWVEVNAGVSFIKNRLAQHLNINDLSNINDLLNIVVDYAYLDVNNCINLCILPVKLKLESKKILEQLEHSIKDEEQNNKPSTRQATNQFSKAPNS